MYGCFFMKNKIYRGIRIFDSVFASLCIVVFTLVLIGEFTMPSKIISYGDEDNDLSSLFSYSGDIRVQSVDARAIVPRKETIKLLGIVPVKNVSVTNKTSQEVYVGGDAFGIKLYTDGVIVVGTQAIDVNGKKVNPAEEAGIEVGDIIVAINNNEVYTSDEVIDTINDNNGKPYRLKIKRNERYKTFVLTPVYSDREGCYKAGMWVRDSTAGIGTITFYNEQNSSFGALGHQINDIDTKELMPMLEGEAVEATVTDVQKASSGSTGSLVCNFSNNTIGYLSENSSSGVFGIYQRLDKGREKYMIASPQEIERGRASIISTIDDKEPKSYEIEISRINYNGKGEKDIVFRVTDKELIEKTGGIVQGMSGSPIIQNGKIVGAVTHVIINNPKKGYGIFAQTMLERSNAVE